MMLRKYFKINIIMIVVIIIMIMTNTKSASAQTQDYQFNFFLRDSFLVFQPDLSSFINSEKNSLLRDGVDYAIEFQITLLRPRRLWGAVQIAQKTEAIVIGFRFLTEEYTLTHLPIDSSLKELRFISLAKLHQFLTDSIILNVPLPDQLNKENTYKIEFKTTSIALTTLNLISSDNNQDDSPVKFLFRQFLDFTGYGREEKTISTVPFKLSELEIID